MSLFSGITHTIQSAVKSAQQTLGAVNHKLGNALSPTFQTNIGEQTRLLGNVGNALETGIGHIIDNTIGPALNHIAEFVGGGIGRSQSLKDAIKNAAEAGAAYLGGSLIGGAAGGSTAGGGAGGGAAEGGAVGGAAGGTGASSLGGAAAVSVSAAGNAASSGSAAASTGEAAAGGAAGNAATQAGGAAAGADLQSTASAKAIIAEIASVIQEVEGAIKGFIQPIADTVNEVNTGIIQPIVGPVQSLLQESKALHDFVTADLHDGIQGILRIPGDLSDALTSFDASIGRALLQLQAAQTDILDKGLTTHGPDFGLTGSTRVALGISTALPGEGSKWEPPARVKLSDTPNVEDFQKHIQAVEEWLNSDDHWYTRLLSATLKSLEVIPGILASAEPYREIETELARRAAPVTKLAPGDVVRLYAAGVLELADAKDELLAQGINESRALALIEGARNLPAIGTVIDWWRRGQLTKAEAGTALDLLGIVGEDIDRYLAGSYTVPDSGQAVGWWQRGLLQESALDQLLRAQGYDAETIGVIKQGATLLPQLADWMRAYDRELALTENSGANLAADNPPQAFLDEAHRLGVSLADASILWANHLQLLPPALAATALFKGYLNRPQFYAYMRAASFTRDQADIYLDAVRPQIPVRSIPALVKTGIISESEAVAQLKSLGFPDIQVDWILRLAEASTRTTGTPTATTIHRDVQNTTVALYNAGTLERPQAEEALTAAGLAPDAVTALLNLEDVKNTAAAHKLEEETVIAQVEGGALNADQAAAALSTYGFNVRELALATARINRATRHRVKLPAEGTLLNMMRRGILALDETKAALVLLGYSQDWADKLTALEVKEHGPLPVAQ